MGSDLGDRGFVVVLGPARSGTSLLRDLIGLHPAAAAVPFDVSHVWRLGNGRHPDDAIPADLATPAVARAIRRRLMDFARRNAGAARWPGVRIVAEKTVGNALRPTFVDRVLDAPRYVRIVRDPRRTIASTVASWQAAPDIRHLARKLRYFGPADVGYAGWYAANAMRGRLGHGRGLRVWGVRYPGIQADLAGLDLESVCARQWLAAVDSIDAFFAGLPPGRGLSVTYEDLIADPAVLARVWSFLGLADDGRVEEIHARTIARPRSDPADLPRSMAEEVRGAVAARMATYGYR